MHLYLLKKPFKCQCYFPNATFTSIHLHLHCRRVLLYCLCCCGSVIFRVHEGVNIVSDFLLKVVGDSAPCSIGERIPSQGCAMYGPSK